MPHRRTLTLLQGRVEGPPPEGKVISASDEIAFFRSLNYEEKIHTLKQKIAAIDLGSIRYTQHVRDHLLPMILLVKQEHSHQGRRHPDPSRPCWEVCCRRALGISPDKVQRWHRKSLAAEMVEGLVGGEKPRRRKPPKRPESAVRVLLKAAKRVIDAQWIEHNPAKANRLAKEFLDAWDQN